MRSQTSLRQLSGRALLLVLCAQAAAPAWSAQPAASQNKPAAARGAQAPVPAEQFVDGIAAIVDKDVITLRELNAAMAQAQRELQAQKIQLPPQEVLQKQVLQRLIMERVQRHEADRMGIKVEDAQLDQAINAIAQRNKLTVPQLRAEVEKSGTNWTDYRRSLADEVRLDRMRQRAVDSQIVISDSEVDAFLKEQERRGGADIGALANSPASAPAQAQPAAAQRGPVLLALAQILVRVPEGASSDQVASLRRKAESILGQVKGGADFASVAAASSDGPEALDGGVMGARPEEGWPTLFIDSVARVPAGQVSDIVRSGAGFHILKVLDRQGGAAPAAAQGQRQAPAQPQQSTGAAPGSAASQGPMQVTQTRARHILIKTSAVMSDDQARQRLEMLRQRITRGGESFASLARQNSQDSTAPQGGELGWLNPGDTVPPFEQAMNRLQPNEISEPIQSQFGWHLIMVEERREKDMAGEFQRMRARQVLFERRAEPAMQDWLEQLRDRAFIDNRLEKEERIQSNNR